MSVVTSEALYMDACRNSTRVRKKEETERQMNREIRLRDRTTETPVRTKVYMSQYNTESGSGSGKERRKGFYLHEQKLMDKESGW
jgi:hypothetical protein